jgi:virginiamycin B lyase
MLSDRTRWMRGVPLIAIFVVGFLVLASRADAYIYWTNNGFPPADPDTRIGRANNDGTAVNQGFIANGGPGPCLIAADASHLFWSNQGLNLDGTTIGRSNLDGSAVEPSFIAGAPASCGVAVDSSHLYWTSGDDTIGRSNLDGTAVNQAFVPGAVSYPCGVAVDGSHIYWGNYFGNAVGRADINGGNVDPNFITGLAAPCGVAVDGQHVYWANDDTPATTIGRADLNGNPASVKNDLVSGIQRPCGVAVFDGKLYWGAYDGNAVGRSNLDGSAVNHAFIPGGHGVCGPAVFAPNTFSAKLKGKKLIVTVENEGTVQVIQASGGTGKSAAAAKKKSKRLKKSTASGKQPQIVVKLKLTKQGKARLRDKGKLTIKTKITFSPEGGTPRTQTKKLKLKQK